ncbi:MAG: hypothetical protein HY870_02435 [Chloroflexi bacterium]|nr:hypothetical protein [Chloroflexota bacterium]
MWQLSASESAVVRRLVVPLARSLMRWLQLVGPLVPMLPSVLMAHRVRHMRPDSTRH